MAAKMAGKMAAENLNLMYFSSVSDTKTNEVSIHMKYEVKDVEKDVEFKYFHKVILTVAYFPRWPPKI